jgi:hypothetical protein
MHRMLRPSRSLGRNRFVRSGVSATFATLDPTHIGTGVVLSNGNLTAVMGVGHSALANMGKAAGKWYWEVHWDADVSCTPDIGVAQQTINLDQYLGVSAVAWGYDKTGTKLNNSSFPAYGATYALGDTIGVALDMDAKTLTFYKNGVSQGQAFTGLSGTIYPGVSSEGGTVTVTVNFGTTPFAFTPPAGHVGVS